MKLIIEIDGRQHFEQVMDWPSPEYNLQRDVFKAKKAIHNNISVMRMLQQRIADNKIEWRDILKQNVKVREKPEEIYIHENNEYTRHIEAMKNPNFVIDMEKIDAVEIAEEVEIEEIKPEIDNVKEPEETFAEKFAKILKSLGSKN